MLLVRVPLVLVALLHAHAMQASVRRVHRHWHRSRPRHLLLVLLLSTPRLHYSADPAAVADTRCHDAAFASAADAEARIGLRAAAVTDEGVSLRAVLQTEMIVRIASLVCVCVRASRRP
jgi:hypothetical protein